ncbi:MAG TPA: methylmalonyl-CoA mutase subunit beta [Pseudoneobacillus sp.]|nr:methylmalonyl-CoA mutase subunit beta [Pseudoneobacillus sp.]
MKNASFITPSNQDWKVAAEESLKGKKIDSLMRNTYENIVLKPLYSKEDKLESNAFPGGSDFRRGVHAVGYHSNPWKIAQKVAYQTVEELKEKLENNLVRGQTALAFRIEKSLLGLPEQLVGLLSRFIEMAPLAVETNGFQKQFINHLISVGGINNAVGFFAEDPLSLWVKSGSFSLDEYLNLWPDTIQIIDQHIANVKSILIDTTTYHNGGANAVQELAIALATAVYYLEELSTRGIDIEKLFTKMIFKFQIGANFFMEISKLRAVRVLWDKIGEAYGVSSEHRAMEIIAETSNFTKTLYDANVNILRSGNEAFAAVLGGVQYLDVHSFNELEGLTPLSERLARNTQLILKEEAYLGNIVDPAGGSWYIESLTNELVEKAWDYFLTIDEKGGILASLESNWLQSEIAEVLHKRQQDVFYRKQSIIGTNVYADLQEITNEVISREDCVTVDNQSIKPIKSRRLSEDFESLRHRALLLKNNQVGLISLGELKEYKARADFMTGFLASGGLAVVRSSSIHSINEAQTFIEHNQLKHYVICGSNDMYSEIGLDLVKHLKENYPFRSFYLAGLPEKDSQADWLEAGISNFVHIKTNCFAFNSSIIAELEEVGNNGK